MFHKILKELRLEKELTQNDMAKSLNISRVAYTNYELGNREPDLDTIIKISYMFEVSLDYLLGVSAIKFSAERLIYGENKNHDSKVQISNFLSDLLPQASALSAESQKDLLKYIELLRIRDTTLY